MPDLRIERDHDLGLTTARRLAAQWIEAARQHYGMSCVHQEGQDADCITFTRSGVNGQLTVTGSRFELDAKLGFLLGAFKERIEAEISRKLDELLASGAASA